LALALESPDHPWVVSNRRSLEKMLAKARATIAELAVEGTPAGAAVSVNGRSVGLLPLPSAVRVPSGRVVVSVTSAGYLSMERVLQLRAKQSEKIAVALEKLPPSVPVAIPSASSGKSAHDSAADAGESPSHPRAHETAEPGVAGILPAPTAAPPPSPANVATLTSPTGASAEPTSSRSGLRVAAWITAGAAVASLAGGVGLQLAHNADVTSFSGAGCSAKDNIVMPPPNTMSPDQCQTLYDNFQREKTWSVVGYVAGGVLAATSAVLFWSSWSDSSRTGTVQAHVHCAPTLGAFFCRGEF
jgi:hypothetical protein